MCKFIYLGQVWNSSIGETTLILLFFLLALSGILSYLRGKVGWAQNNFEYASPRGADRFARWQTYMSMLATPRQQKQKQIPNLLLVLLMSCLPTLLSGQNATIAIVQNISFEGNKKTRDYILLRELDFNVGDTIQISDLSDKLERSEYNLINTSLFTLASVNVREWDMANNEIEVEVKVKEAWYLYIVPIAELSDRNFNVWWNEFNGDIKRLNLGVRVQHLNTTGNNDRIKFLAQFGFTPKFELEYAFPNINKAKTLGASINIFRSINKETNYRNEGNKLLFFKMDEQRMLRRNRLRANLAYRPNLYAKHEWKAEIQDNRINPLIGADLNPDYFLDGRTNQRFISLLYEFSYDERDVKVYPLKGFYSEISIEKNGIGIWKDIDQLTLSPRAAIHFQPVYWMSTGHGLTGKISLNRKKPPYFQNRGLGYGSKFIRGYELYVIDGQDYFLTQNSIKFRLLNKQFNLGKLMFIDQFRVMPVRLYFSLNFDAGYVNENFYQTKNDFTNRWLYGGGPALDVLIFNNFLFQFEVSANHIGEVGLFIHNTVSF